MNAWEWVLAVTGAWFWIAVIVGVILIVIRALVVRHHRRRQGPKNPAPGETPAVPPLRSQPLTSVPGPIPRRPVDSQAPAAAGHTIASPPITHTAPVERLIDVRTCGCVWVWRRRTDGWEQLGGCDINWDAWLADLTEGQP